MMIVVRYQSLAANAVREHRFQSVARPLRCDGIRAGIKRGPPLRIFPALFNLFGLTKAARSLFRALYQPSKQTSRIFAVSFRPGPFVALALRCARSLALWIAPELNEQPKGE